MLGWPVWAPTSCLRAFINACQVTKLALKNRKSGSHCLSQPVETGSGTNWNLQNMNSTTTPLPSGRWFNSILRHYWGETGIENKMLGTKTALINVPWKHAEFSVHAVTVLESCHLTHLELGLPLLGFARHPNLLQKKGMAWVGRCLTWLRQGPARARVWAQLRWSPTCEWFPNLGFQWTSHQNILNWSQLRFPAQVFG
jgi:hypothetical protein